MKKVYEITSAILIGLLFIGGFLLLLSQTRSIVNKVTRIVATGAKDVQSNQPTSVPPVQGAAKAASVEIKAFPQPSGKGLSISSSEPNITANGAGLSRDYPTLIFSKNNTLTFRDVITAKSVSDIQVKLIQMSHSLPETTPIYLVLDTPGGSIDAGLSLISTARGLPQEVKTVTLFAASMGFHTVQSLGERYVLSSGTLMSHRASIGGLSGQVPGEAVTRLNALIRLTTEMDEKASKRIGMSLADYQNLIRDEYWVQGENAVKESMADKTVYGRCAEDMNGSYTQVVMTLFGAFTVEWSNCPLISAPLRIDVSDTLRRLGNSAERYQFIKFINTFVNDKKAFTQRYIINREYVKILGE